ncbi:MAG: cell division protein ZapA [Alphaproteobacteria bacterium]|nr:cell division protein ZapA [Alphaproteobacteria bacterium]
MSELFLTINGRNYTVACEDGQEEHLGRLAEYVKMRVEELVESIGQIGDARLILMVALLISDELSDAYAEMASLRDGDIEGAVEIEGEGDASALRPAPAISLEIKPEIKPHSSPENTPESGSQTLNEDEDALAQSLEDLADRIEAIAQRLEEA